jgi:DNA-binding CsgD family transcriptional regulator
MSPHNEAMPTERDLVGRQAELAQLSRVLTENAKRAVVVCGEPGVGKTALIEQLCASATTSGWQVVRVLGAQAEESYTLGGLNQLVFGLKTSLAGLDERDRIVLTPVLGGDPESSVSVLPMVTAVLNLLSVAAQTRPLLLVADDVHWLDGVSAEVLGAVGRRLADPRVRIVAGRRALPESMFSHAGWNELPLGPLSAEDSANLLELTGVSLTAATRAAILTASAGNPLALAELPRSAAQFDYSAEATPLTERLVEVFGNRLNQLSPDVRAELLRSALDGVTGNAMSANSARYVMRNVDAAVAAGLLIVNPLGHSVFRHPLVRAAVIHQATPPERCDAHRHLAGLYDDVLVRRASHLAAATTEPDQEVANLLVQAARLSGRRGGLGISAEWLRRAADLSTDPDQRAELIADAIFIAARAGRLSELHDVLETIGTGPSDRALAVLADSYRAFHADGEVISTHRRLVDALTRADTLDDRTVNRLANLLLSITNFSGDTGHQQQTTKALLPLGARLNPVVMMYRTDLDDIAHTAQTVRSMLTQYTEWLPRMTAPQVMLLSFPAYCVDAMTDFRAPLQQAFTTLSEHGASIDAIECGRVVMLDLIAAGQWEQAEQVGATCLEMSKQPQGSALVRHELLADLGLLAACRGDLDVARRYAAEVTAWSQPRGLNLLLDIARRISVRVALAEADYEAAYRAAIAISPPGQFPPHNVEVGEDMLDLVTAATLAGHTGEASTHVAEAVRLRIGDYSPRVAALNLAVQAMIAPDSEPDELYRSALTHPGIAEFPFDHARIALAQGMWLRRSRRPTEAGTVLELAAETFDRLGARPWAERARAEFRAAAAATNQSPGEYSVLSAQELRTAELAANGQTTKQIAEQLSLSPRTVDAHLSRAFRKLGITRRAALSQALLQHDSELRAAVKGDAQ